MTRTLAVPLAVLTLAILMLAEAASPSRAQTQSRTAQSQEVVDIELVLAVDVSWSMDIDEQILQRRGYVEALRHPEVIAAIENGDWGSIALTYVEWAGVGLERILVPWTIVDDAASADAFARALERAPIGRMRRTSISSILTRSAALFDNEVEGLRRVIDVSGDGPNNMGLLVTAARDAVLAQGIVINGLPIMIKRGNPGGFFHLEDLDIYYEDCVIGGFGAFMITVNDPERFKEAIRRKLILEIASPLPQRAPGPRLIPASTRAPEAEPRVDCQIGEKQWREWRRMDRW